MNVDVVGYWEPVTASVDWCEANYAVTRYVAEFWNALSSLAICLVGLIALWLCHAFRLERRFYVLQSLVIVIGIGSAAFHGTLRYDTQMWDEIPMIWALLSWYYLLLQLHSPPRRGAPWLRTLLVVYALVIAFVHYLCAFTTAFQVHFVIMVTVGFLLVYHLRKPRDAPAFAYMTRLYFYVFLIASACWLLDKLMCEPLTALLPLNPQLHAWWHVLMAINVHFGTQYSLALRLQVLNLDPRPRYILGLPFVVPSLRPGRDQLPRHC